jgi:hypothetical protein
MKKASALAILIIFYLFVVSSSNAEVTDECSLFHKNAEIVMTLRQMGAAMPKVMDVITEFSDNEDDVALQLAIVNAAFEIPRTLVSAEREIVISDFANKMALTCYKIKAGVK